LVAFFEGGDAFDFDFEVALLHAEEAEKIVPSG
jgi:hypothetical protein